MKCQRENVLLLNSRYHWTPWRKNYKNSLGTQRFMGMFKDMLGSQESLFLDPIPLDFDFIPKLVPYREAQQHQIATCIKPLFAERNGRNIFIYGPPGVGKTVACRHILRELEDETDAIIPIYINCWQKNTSYKIALELCSILGYRFTHNKKTDDLFRIVKDILNKKAAVIVFDEVDKLEESDFIYTLLEDVYKKTVILIANHKEWIVGLDARIKSRLTAEMLEFGPYNKEETAGILRERSAFAFVPGTWDADALTYAVECAYRLKDIRAGLYLLKEAGNAAEDAASKKITKEHVSIAIQKFEEFSIKKKDSLADETRFILELVKKNSGMRIGDMFKIYQQEGGESVYKTFSRHINKLGDSRFVSLKKIMGGPEGNTTIVTHTGQGMTTLSDFSDAAEK